MPDLNTYNMAKEMGAKKDVVGAALGSSATTAQLANVAHAINTTGKYQGKTVYNTDTHALVVAGGAGAGNTWWNVGTGVAAHVPA